MKKSLVFLIALLLTTGLATAQVTGGDKAPKSRTAAVTADAPADPHGAEEYAAARKHRKGGKGRSHGQSKKGGNGRKIKITPDPSCSGSRCTKGL